MLYTEYISYISENLHSQNGFTEFISANPYTVQSNDFIAIIVGHCVVFILQNDE